ncbi:30S ribosome-binding factor RbfA [Desulfonauticus submarinus]
MNQKSFKKLRLAEEIKESLSKTIIEEANDESFIGITITGVKLSSDLRKAIILYTYFKGKSETINHKLNKAKGFFRSCLAKKIRTKYIPELEFIWDEYLGTMFDER